jgi:hypothetical protein
MSRVSDPLTTEIIMLLINNIKSQMLNDAINKVTTYIQCSIDVSKLTISIQAILNMWWRTGWYRHNGRSKFEHCLRVIVSRHLMQLANTFLNEQKLCFKALDEDDLSLALDRATIILCQNKLSTLMQTELLFKANRIIAKDKDIVLISDNVPFSWFNTKTGTLCHHLPHIPMCHDFQSEQKLICSICLEFDTVSSTCVRTTCMHVFHKSCLKSWNCKFLEQEDNSDKIYNPCPICRTDVYIK